MKVVTGSSEDQEKPAAGGADTYLKLFASGAVDEQLELRRRKPHLAPTERSYFELSLDLGSRTIRDQFLIFPSAKPFASNGLAVGGNPSNDRSTRHARIRALVTEASRRYHIVSATRRG